MRTSVRGTLTALALLGCTLAPAWAATRTQNPLDRRENGGNDRGHPGRGSEPRTLLELSNMYGVDGPFVGDAAPIRGVPGDELPWEVDSVHGRLDTDGHLTIRVRGLVFKDDPSVPPALRGINDEAEFRGLVSCLTEDGDSVATANVLTAGFPATKRGDANILATVALPNPCVAPIVMILAGSENKWFAVNGFEAEQGD